MGTQKLIAQKITDANADYVLCLKDNHPTLHQQVKQFWILDFGFWILDFGLRITNFRFRLQLIQEK
jgi:predicted transposase YbfD/YdcC